MMFVLIIIVVIFVLAPMADAYAKRLKQLPPDPQARAEIARLREEVDQLTAQVNRLHDEQAFTLRLLTEGERRTLPGEQTERPSS